MRSLAQRVVVVVVILVAATLSALADVDADDRIQRDVELDVSLAELLAYQIDDHTRLDAKIQQAFAQCRAHGVIGVVECTNTAQRDGDEGDDALRREDVEFCYRIRYARHFRQRQRARNAAVVALEGQLKQEGRDRREAQALEVRVAEQLEYQSFFETYAERRFPVVLQSAVPQREQLLSFVDACFDRHRSMAPMLFERQQCTDQLEDFHLPLVVANNFVIRTNASTAPPLLPTLLTVAERPLGSLDQFTCPFNLHTLFQPLEGQVEYHLFESEFILGNSLADENEQTNLQIYKEISVSTDSNSNAASPSSLLSEFARVGPAFSGRVSIDQLLFVPGGSFSVVLADASPVLRFCFVDASNLNRVIETLRVDALVSSLARTLFLSFRSPAFDTSMTRRPSQNDALWSSYMLWPKETKLLKRRNMVSTESGSSAGSGADEAVPMSRRERLKLWQEDKRWERHVESLTLPLPLPPVVINVTRSSVTLRWQDLYERPRNDITLFGYEVRWKRDEVDRPSEGDDEEASSSAANFTHKQFVRSVMPTTLFGDGFDGKDLEGVVRGLAADTSYTFTVRIFVGDNVGVESERSHSVRTASCTAPAAVAGVATAAQSASGTCVDVRWLASSDDGGRRITSYVFALRYVEEPLDPREGREKAHELGDDEVLAIVNVQSTRVFRQSIWLSASVCGQIPGRVRLRVAAVNPIGMSSWSRFSDPVVINSNQAAKVVATVRGRGDPAVMASPSTVFNASASVTGPLHLPRVILSDVNEQVTVVAPGAANGVRFDVWAGHHSPRGFHVSSELMLSDPLDAAQPLRNTVAVRGRVVVIARGGVPFLFKLRHAQRAGAVGVIFADLDGSCLRGFDQNCVPGASKLHGEGFGLSDRHQLWRHVRIPFVLALPDASAMLVELLRA